MRKYEQKQRFLLVNKSLNISCFSLQIKTHETLIIKYLSIEGAKLIEYKKENSDSVDVNSDECPHARRGRFKFSMVGIKIGEKITFTPTGTVVTVASDDTVEYDGRIYKLSPFVGTFMPVDRRNTSNAYQGAKFFSYNGKILDDLRKEAECGQ